MNSLDKKFDELLTLLKDDLRQCLIRNYEKQQYLCMVLFLEDEEDIAGFKQNMFKTKFINSFAYIIERALLEWQEYVAKTYPAIVRTDERWADNLTWKDRLFRHYYKLLEDIEFATEYSENRQNFEKEVAKLYDKFINNLNTLLVTEMTHIENATICQYCKNNGIEYVQWHTFKDERSCNECMKLDKHIFRVGEKECPEHPNCRCVLLPYKK